MTATATNLLADRTAYCVAGTCGLCPRERAGGLSPCACRCHTRVSRPGPGSPRITERVPCPDCGKPCRGAFGVELHRGLMHPKPPDPERPRGAA